MVKPLLKLLLIAGINFILPAASAHAKSICKGNLCVIDGDTISFKKERIRIANIDAPEIKGAKCSYEHRLGQAAKQRLYDLLISGHMKISRGDPADGRMKDRYKRTLAVISLNGKDVGEILVKEGLARHWQGKRQPWCKNS